MAHLDLLNEYLKTLDEIQLCELLNISSEDIIQKFQDRIHKRKKFLYTEMEMLDSSMEEDEQYQGPEELNFDD